MLPIALHRLVYRLSPASVRNRLKDSAPLGVARFPLVLPDGQAITLDHLECSKILRRFAWKGIYGYEPDTIRLFQVLAKDARGVLDIGAYFGLYAIIAAKANPQAVIHAFEPLPENIRLLNHFLALNHCTQVVTHPVAIAQRRGKAPLYIPEQRRSTLPATGSLRNRFLPGKRFDDLDAQTIPIETAPLDALIEKIGIRHVDLVKIDTEETEHEVITSGIRTLERFRPDIVLEITFRNPQVTVALGTLRELEYRFFHIDANGLSRFDERQPDTGKHAAATEDLVHCEILCTCRTDSDLPQY